MTADHTPERLSEEEREAHVRWCVDILRSYGIEEYRCEQIAEALLDDGLAATTVTDDHIAALKAGNAILAAHLADVEARLAAVEAEVTGAGCMCRGAHYVCVKHRVTAALHPGQGSPR